MAADFTENFQWHLEPAEASKTCTTVPKFRFGLKPEGTR